MKHFGLFALLVLVSVQSWGWGRNGHEIVAAGAARLATEGTMFWKANETTLSHLSVVPDRVWKLPKTYNYEKHTHFTQADGYFSNPIDFPNIPHSYSKAVERYGVSFVRKNGTATWRVQQLYSMALEQLKAGNFARGLELAGTMSHYIGDLSQPLHVTKSYDGETADDEGIHAYFETTIVAAADQKTLLAEAVARAAVLLRNPAFVKAAQGAAPVDTAFLEMERSHPFYKKILTIDRRSGRKEEGAARQMEIVKGRLADGIATLALIYTQLWKDSGMTDQGLSFGPTDPAFVPVDYSAPPFTPMDGEISEFSEDEDDCAL